MPVAKVEEYRDKLRDLADWEPYLLDESRLPGPQANLELVEAVADLGTRRRFEQLLTWTADRGPTGSKEEFLALCGTVGLGRLVTEGEARLLPRLRSLASDPRWRIREGVAMALQALAYCWSVAVAAAPEAGRPLMDKWIGSEDRDVRWLMKQNLAKNRLAAAGRDWVERWRKQPS